MANSKKQPRIIVTAKSSVYSFRKVASDYTILRLLYGKLEAPTQSCAQLIKKHKSAYGAAMIVLAALQARLHKTNKLATAIKKHGAKKVVKALAAVATIAHEAPKVMAVAQAVAK